MRFGWGRFWMTLSAGFEFTGGCLCGQVRFTGVWGGEPLRACHCAERGFCPTCGASLFWRRIGSDHIDVAAGSVDAPTGLTLAAHIHVEDKGDYYQIDDGLPQLERE